MSSNAERFGMVVMTRRLELDLNQLEAGAAGGPSNTTLTAIENGRITDLSRTTARKLDKALQWEPGSAKRTWLGGDPAPLEAVGDSRLAQTIAEIEASGISEASKRYAIDLLKRQDADLPQERGETA